MQQGLVSVIIPCYNHAHYLGAALNSVLTQTYDKWEAIVIDDGSTDNTYEVAHQVTDARIRYIYQENQGLSAARNTGIRAARGEYLAFLDADDEWYPDFLDTCIDVLNMNDDPHIVGAYTSHVYIDEAGEVLPQSGSGVVPPHDLPARLVAGNFFPPHVVLVQAKVVGEVGLFDEELHSCEDKDLWFRITRGYTFIGIPQRLAKYRVYPGTMSTDAARMHRNRTAVLRKHFGPDDGDPALWSPNKRLAYSSGYRASALGFMAQGDAEAGWSLLLRGASISPQILAEQRTYSEMACVGQPRGYRGIATDLDIPLVAREILSGLRAHVDRSDQPFGNLYNHAVGSAHLAFAALADQADDWRLARSHLRHAVRSHPPVFLSKPVARRALKLVAGKRLANLARALLGSRDDDTACTPRRRT